MKQSFESPTRFVWVNGQMQSNGPQDYDVVNGLQKQYKLTPLSAWGQPYAPPAHAAFDPGVDTNSPPLEQVNRMDARAFFGRLARLMKDNPPAPADAPMLEKLRQLGIEPGGEFDIGSVDGNVARGLTRAMTWAPKLLQKGIRDLKTEDGWIVIPANFANYGTDYLTRAGIALIGLGGVLPKDILYPTAFKDSEGEPLDGVNVYVLHFDKEQLPPCLVTWSVSLYDAGGFYVPNETNRYHLAAWMPLKYNADGSVDIFIQAESPGSDKEQNWLPAPASGLFNLTTRVFWPSEAALDGTWKMPGVRRLQ